MRRIYTAVGMLNAGVFLYEQFNGHIGAPKEEKGIRSSLFIPTAVTFAFGIEVGLKAIIEAQGDAPPYHHDLLKLYRKILPDTQDSIERFASERVPELTDVQTLLKEHRKSFETWRYLEDTTGILAIPLTAMGVILEAIVFAHKAKYGINVAENGQNAQAVAGPSEEVDNFAFEYARRVFGSRT